MNRNSTDFACLVTGFLTDYLPLQRCYSFNTLLSYRDTLKLFLRFLGEAKGISPVSFYVKDFKRELVIEFLEWYRQKAFNVCIHDIAYLREIQPLIQFLHCPMASPVWSESVHTV